MSRTLLVAVLLMTGCDLIPTDDILTPAIDCDTTAEPGADTGGADLDTQLDEDTGRDTAVDTGRDTAVDTAEPVDEADALPLIRTLPDQTRGYLTLSDQGNRDIVSFDVIVSDRTYEDFTTWTDEEIVRLEVGSEKYVDLSEYLGDGDRSLSVTVEARAASGEIILTDGPAPIGPNSPWEHACSTVCNGPDFAWEVELWANVDNGGANLSLVSTDNYFDEGQQLSIPFYEYMDSTGFSAFMTGGASILTYHNLPDFYVDGYNIIKLTGVTSGLSDSGGYPVTGTVYGVRKHLGPWVGPHQSIQDMTNGSSNCQFMDDGDVSWESNAFDVYSDILADGLPSLTCSTGSVGGGGNTSNPDGTTPMANQYLIDCGPVLLTGTAGDIYDLLAAVDGCPGDSGGVSPGIGYPLGADTLSIHQLNDISDGVTIAKDELFSADGEFTGPEVTLPPGLFNFSFQFEDGTVAPVIVEVTEQTTSSYALSNFLAVEIDEHSMRPTLSLAAGATLEVELVVTDGDKELYAASLALGQGESSEQRLSFDGRETPDMLEYSFSFEDGSELTLSTARK